MLYSSIKASKRACYCSTFAAAGFVASFSASDASARVGRFAAGGRERSARATRARRPPSTHQIPRRISDRAPIDAMVGPRHICRDGQVKQQRADQRYGNKEGCDLEYRPNCARVQLHVAEYRTAKRLMETSRWLEWMCGEAEGGGYAGCPRAAPVTSEVELWDALDGDCRQ